MQKKVIAITGCVSGLGRALALKLNTQGHCVYAGVRDLTAIQVKQNIFHQLDITNENDITSFVGKIQSKHNTIDCLVNNAAICLVGAIETCTIEQARSIFEVNVIGTLNISNKIIEIMKERRSGRLVFISSISGIESSSFIGLYSATKFAIEAIALSYAATLHKWNIGVTIVEPGAMNTTLPNKLTIGSRYTYDLDAYKKFHNNSLNAFKEILSKGITPEDAAEIVMKAIFDPFPRLRYQTCNYSHNIVKKHLVDPQEVDWLKNERKLVDDSF